MKTKTLLKRTIRKFIPFEKRAKLFWRFNTIKLAFSSSFNAARNSGEFMIAEKFHDYFYGISPEVKNELIKTLKNNLSPSSCDEIDLILFRQDYIFKHNLLEQKKLFSDTEMIEQKICAKESALMRKRIRNFEIKTYSAESFFGLSGTRWLPCNAKERLNNGVFLDVGAYDGDSALSFCFSFDPKKVYAFEPETENYERLERNSKLYNPDIIIPVKSGASSSLGKANISHEHSGSKINQDTSGETIKLTTIDNFVESNSLKNVDLIKMDIEGMEMEALKGAEKIIKEFKPILAISIYHNPEDFFLIKPWLENLIPEYKFIIKKANPFSLSHEVMLLAYTE